MTDKNFQGGHNMKYVAFVIGIFAICAMAIAQENNVLQTELEEEIFQQQNENPNKSIIYVFFNNQPCPNCPQAIEMIENVYNQNYLNNYEFFLINYGEDENAEMVQQYELSQPLEVVMVDVANGNEMGFKKIEGLEYMIDNPLGFSEFFTTQVNGYLGE